ncbi:MAG: MarR family transcriptional regulator [Desulfobacca sp.]|nr:MarR family transcriptional regulator [Desulfobacca sp.]
MKDEKLHLHGRFQSLMRLTRELDKTPRNFGTGEKLSHSEIHLIEIIGEKDNMSVTDISNHLGITKGAVSQSLKRLEAKGFSEKKIDPENLSRAIVMLTSKGYTAYYAHKHWHETMDGGFAKYMDEMDKRDTAVIVRFLEKLEDFLKRRLRSRS